jgi:hypothetical protein
MLAIALSMGFLCAEAARAGAMMTETFAEAPETRWRFLADTVMGGISTGRLVFLKEGELTFARLTGKVSTANRGGFIQMRSSLAEASPAGTTGVRLIVRGNNQRYFTHLRTRASVFPTQFHQAGFEVTRSWREVRLPFSAFQAQGRALPEPLNGPSLTSIGIVAYGRDHDAEIDVREVGFY